jgi:hypothetical protein
MSTNAAATADPFADLDQAIAAFGQLARGVSPDQLTAATPCTEFDRTGMRFAAEQPVPDDAQAADRLAGFLGRPV